MLIGAGARIAVAAQASAISFAVANLADMRIDRAAALPPPSPTFTRTPTALADVAGFPLPGRSFYVAMDWSH